MPSNERAHSHSWEWFSICLVPPLSKTVPWLWGSAVCQVNGYFTLCWSRSLFSNSHMIPKASKLSCILTDISLAALDRAIFLNIRVVDLFSTARSTEMVLIGRTYLDGPIEFEIHFSALPSPQQVCCEAFLGPTWIKCWKLAHPPWNLHCVHPSFLEGFLSFSLQTHACPNSTAIQSPFQSRKNNKQLWLLLLGFPWVGRF